MNLSPGHVNFVISTKILHCSNAVGQMGRRLGSTTGTGKCTNGTFLKIKPVNGPRGADRTLENMSNEEALDKVVGFDGDLVKEESPVTKIINQIAINKELINESKLKSIGQIELIFVYQ